MTVLLRGYQSAAVENLRQAFISGAKAPIYACATGSGKTAVASEVIRLAALKGSTVLFIVHRRELLLQGSRSLREFGVAHGIEAAGFPYTGAAVRIASVQTLVHRLDKLRRPDLIVLDEGHHATAGSWTRIREKWPTAKILGLSATPCRLDGRGLNEVFDRLVLGPTMKDLIEQGHLCRVEVYAPPIMADLSHLHVVAGDFSKADLKAAVDKPKIVGDAIAHYQKLGKGERALAFCAGLDHSAHICEAFRAAGIAAESIDGTMETDERDAILARFHSGETRVLTSVDLLGEGFDCADATVAIILSPTLSLAKHLQRVGRIMRPAPGKIGIVLDHVGDTERHGLPDADREWTLEGRRRTQGERVPPMSRCPACFSCFPPPADRVCPMCHADLPVKERAAIESVAGELERVEAKAAKVALRREQGQCRTLEELQALGKRLGRAPGWAWMVWSGRHHVKAVGREPVVGKGSASGVA
jgi:DNA repair protein RadD